MILLDMDGPVVNFHKGACLLHNKPLDFPEGQSSHHWSLSDEQFFKHADRDWWASLEPQPWLRELIWYIDGHDWTFCTCPAPVHPVACVAGKQDWMRKHDVLPQYPPIFDCKKHKYARNADGTRNLLIDDNIKNVRGFRGSGGRAFYFEGEQSLERLSTLLLDV